MSIPALPPIGASAVPRPAPVEQAPAAGFGDLLRQGLEHVSALERSADTAATGFAVGDGTKVHDVMIAGSKSQVAVELLSQLRNRAVEAYGEIMRLQV